MNCCDYDTSGLYYKHMTIVNYASSVINQLDALLTDNARVIIYNRNVFIHRPHGTYSQILRKSVLMN
jgi:hypothetical protein